MTRARSWTPAASVVLLILVASPSVASHFKGDDAVDGGEVRYEQNSKYEATFSYAKAEWNAVGSVDFKADSATTSADLEVQDVDRSSVSWAGQQVARSWPRIDLLQLNEYYMDSFDARLKKNVMVHEMGHALGLGDHDSESWNAIMFHAVQDWIEVHAHDRSDYHSLWG